MPIEGKPHSVADPGTRTETGAPAVVPGPRPERVGRYILLGTLGSGAFGVVYKAHDPELDRQVAIKLLASDRNRPFDRVRFQREAQAIARLSHPNVVAVFDIGRHEDQVFIAMELVDGCSLKEWLAAEERSLGAVLEVFSQAGRGLAAAHDKGLVHRDFKPSNVLVSPAGEVRVADFGLARAYRDDEPGDGEPADIAGAIAVDATVTMAGGVVGTPAYMAPEQLAGGAVDGRADQYSFCVSLYEAVVGRRPGAPPSESAGARRFVPPLARASGAPRWLQLLLQRGLSAHPDERFPTMAALLAALEHGRGRRRRRRVAVGAALVAGVAGFSAARGCGAEPPRMCSGFEQQLDQVWGPERRTAVFAAFRQAAAPFAEDAFRAADGALSAYASSWVEARIDACEATHVRGEQSGELLDLRMACLDRRRLELGELVRAFEHADADVVERAADAAGRLRPIDDCADAETLLRLERLPAEPAARDEARALEPELAQLKTLADLHRLSGAVSRAEAVLERARRAGLSAAAAEAAFWLGQLREVADDLPGAAAAYRDSILEADAARDDRRRLEAYLELIALEDDAPAPTSESERAVAHAAKLVQRLGARAADRIALGRARALHEAARGEPLAALEHAEAALELAREVLSPQDPALAEVLRVYGGMLESLGRREEARDARLEALHLGELALGEHHPRVGELLLSASYAHSILDELDAAEALARRGLELYTNAYGDTHSRTGHAWGELAIVLMRGGRYEEALVAQRHTLRIIVDTLGANSKRHARALTNASLIYRNLGRLDEAEDHARRAVEAYELSAGPEHHHTGAAIGRVAAVMRARGKLRESIALHERAAAILRAANPEHPRLLDQIRGIALCYEDLGRAAEAVPWLEEGLRISAVAEEAPLYRALLERYAARIFWDTGHDRRRALELARSARDHFVMSTRPEDAAEVEAWLAERTGR